MKNLKKDIKISIGNDSENGSYLYEKAKTKLSFGFQEVDPILKNINVQPRLYNSKDKLITQPQSGGLHVNDNILILNGKVAEVENPFAQFYPEITDIGWALIKQVEFGEGTLNDYI